MLKLKQMMLARPTFSAAFFGCRCLYAYMLLNSRVWALVLRNAACILTTDVCASLLVTVCREGERKSLLRKLQLFLFLLPFMVHLLTT